MKLTKRSDWQAQLCRYLSDVACKPFRPGTHDCARFAAGAVEVQTGVDLARGWQAYRTLEQGQEMLRAHGYSGHIDLVAGLLPEVPVLRARVGDIAVLDGDLGASLGVVQGAGVFALTPAGIGMVPLSDAKRMFRV